MSMPYLLHRFLLVTWLFIGTFFLADCQSKSQESQDTGQTQTHHRKHRKRQRDRDYRRDDNQQRTQGFQSTKSSQGNDRVRTQSGKIPQKVYDVLAYIRANHRAMDGYVGGRRFGNFENHLPRSDADGKPIDYQEWDVNPKVKGRNRGTERLITGSDGHAWYTDDHYNTFTEVK